MLWYTKISYDGKVIENGKHILEILETFHFSQSDDHSGILVLGYFIYGYNKWFIVSELQYIKRIGKNNYNNIPLERHVCYYVRHFNIIKNENL